MPKLKIQAVRFERGAQWYHADFRGDGWRGEAHGDRHKTLAPDIQVDDATADALLPMLELANQKSVEGSDLLWKALESVGVTAALTDAVVDLLLPGDTVPVTLARIYDDED